MFYPQEQQDTILEMVAQLLDDKQILWAVGGTTLLRLYGITKESNHITILISSKDIKMVDRLLSSVGQKHPRELSPSYASRYYCRYTVQNQEVQVISGMALHYKGFLFTYPFARQSICQMCRLRNVALPMMAIEDWYVLYQMMPGRETAVENIEHYFATHGLQNPDRFESMRRYPLPPAVIASILRWTSMLQRA